jgi:GNAT superfamily N-acetyltransferase
MSQIVVRTAIAGDAAAACAIVRRSIADLCVDDHHGDKATIAAWLENKTVQNFSAWIASARHVALVAEDESGLLGFALLNRSGKIALLYVAPQVRFRGVSKALLVALERAAVAHGLRQLDVVSTSTALRFYETCGYASSGDPKRGFGLSWSHPLSKRLAD